MKHNLSFALLLLIFFPFNVLGQTSAAEDTTNATSNGGIRQPEEKSPEPVNEKQGAPPLNESIKEENRLSEDRDYSLPTDI